MNIPLSLALVMSILAVQPGGASATDPGPGPDTD